MGQNDGEDPTDYQILEEAEVVRWLGKQNDFQPEESLHFLWADNEQ